MEAEVAAPTGRASTAEGRARTYHRCRLWLSVAGFLLAVSYMITLTATGAAVALRDRLSALTPHWWVQLALALVILGAGYRLLALPLHWAGGFWLPRRYGLLHQPFHRWLWDVVKGTVIGALLGLLGAEILYAFLRATSWWWLWSATLFFAGYAFLAWVTPVWLLPLFYRLTPLDDADLRDRLLGLAAKAGVPVLGVWIADQSRKSRTANAAVIGLYGTRRIVLFDTLVKEFTPAEIEAVLAHELAHQVHHDVGRGLLLQGAFTLAIFWVTGLWLRVGAARFGLSGPADLGGLPLLGLIVTVLGLAILPMANGWSRRVEGKADDFAVRTAGNPEAFITAMQRLGDLNLAERDPHYVKEFLLYSHPSITRRVARARTLLRSSP
jgi:Zn-dependent protease with chaperone function